MIYNDLLTHDVIDIDTRTRDTVNELEKKLGSSDYLRNQTGLPLSTYFSGIKLKWIIDNIPEARNAIEKGNAQIGTVDTFLTHTLTGKS